MNSMTPNQPYLLRAFYDWILDNGLTPHVVVDTRFPGVQVPQQFIQDNQIVLNVSPSACVNFSLDLEWIDFQARFSGQAMNVSFPCTSVAAIYAKENGAGTVFTVPENELESSDESLAERPFESGLSEVEDAREESQSKATTDVDNGKDKKESKKKGPPTLRVIK